MVMQGRLVDAVAVLESAAALEPENAALRDEAGALRARMENANPRTGTDDS